MSMASSTRFDGRSANGTWRRAIAVLLVFVPISLCAIDQPPPDPGFEASVKAADVIVDCDILVGGPFRAAAVVRKLIKGNAPKIFQIEGYNSYNWDTVHQGLSSGSRYILFLSKTGQADLFATLTPAAPRFSVLQDGALFALGDPPFRVPIKPATLEDGLALLIEAGESGKTPERAEAFIRSLWDEGDIEPRYLAVELAGALQDKRLSQMLIDASKDKLLKMRLTAIGALGKVRSPETVGALHALLKDPKASISREAARVLAEIQDVDSLPDLLQWIRKSAADVSSSEKAKQEAVASSILAFAKLAGPLLDAETLGTALIQIARGKSEAVARQALDVLGYVALAPQITALLELADDTAYSLHIQASAVLERITLKSFRDTDEFRTWWSGAEKTFGEDYKRDRVESAAKILSNHEGGMSTVETIRTAPAGIALVSAAPLLIQDVKNPFSTDDLVTWRSPLALPFLIERLGRAERSERQSALDGIVYLASVHPRLKDVLWPLVKAVLADDDSSCRRATQAACGIVPYPSGAEALIDAIQYHGSYEAQDASRALYSFSARTLGFSIKEPVPEQNAAQKRLRGWWQASEKTFTPVGVEVSNSVLNPKSIWPEMEGAARGTRLEGLLLNSESRVSASAFGVLFAERPANAPLWKKLLTQPRQRDRAYGILGMVGGDASMAADIAQRFTKDVAKEGETVEPPLCRCVSLVALATLKGGKGAESIVDWLKGPGVKAGLVLRRMAIMSLGLSDPEPRSLAYLGELLDANLAAKAPDRDSFSNDKGDDDDYAILVPTVIALTARTDGTSLLMKTLSEAADARIRHRAARALSLRRHRPAVAAILEAIDKADRYTWQELANTLNPLLEPGDAPLLSALLDDSTLVSRSAAAFLLATRPEIGTDTEIRERLTIGLKDNSYLVRAFCALALGRRHDEGAVKKIAELLMDDDDQVKNAAIEALGDIGEKMSCKAAARVLEDTMRFDTRLNLHWLPVLAIGGSETQFTVVMNLCRSNYLFDQRGGVSALSGSDRPAALETLLKHFRDDDSASQTVALDGLARRKDVLPSLAQDLKSADRSVRARAIFLLTQMRSPEALDVLQRAAKEDADEALRELAEHGLKK